MVNLFTIKSNTLRYTYWAKKGTVFKSNALPGFVVLLEPLVLRWFNFNPGMDK